MKKITVKNTYDLSLAGKPSDSCESLETPALVGVNPSRIKGIKPKLLVKQGETVKVGSPLFFDKQDEANVFLSPAAGTVKEIVFGERRAIKRVIIETANEDAESVIEPVDRSKISEQKAEDLAKSIQKGGLWSSFTAFPFQVTPKSSDLPPAIYVTIDNDEPYLPQSHVYLDGQEDSFLMGLDILNQLTENVYVGFAKDTQLKSPQIKQRCTHEISGGYPANNPGVFLYYNKKTAAENASWGIKGQDVIRLAQLFQTGQYPNKKVIVAAGALIDKPRHIQITEGTSIQDLSTGLNKNEPLRVVCGGVLTGQHVDEDDFVGPLDNAVHFLREGREQEAFTFFRPGADKPTFGRTYLSALVGEKEWKMNSSLNGGHRACISCGECPKVCPVDLQPQSIMKQLYVDDIETAMEQGFLDCVQCGLCTYVCPSKINLDTIFSDAKARILKEVE